jgi:hypothetical protein
MANDAPDTAGAQFWMLDGSARNLDGGHTIFGQCGPDATIASIASAASDSALPLTIRTIHIHRRARRTTAHEAVLADGPGGDEFGADGADDDRSGFVEPVPPGAPGDPGEHDGVDARDRGSDDSRGVVPSPGAPPANPPPPAAAAPGEPPAPVTGTPPRRVRRGIRDATGDEVASSPNDPGKTAPTLPGRDAPAAPDKAAPDKDAPLAPGKGAAADSNTKQDPAPKK